MRGHLPLEGLRVLDLASFIAGPVATTVLGDYGAEVIKIEPPGEGDPQRRLGQAHSVPQHPVNFCWHMTNRNKRAIVLDLKHPEGRSVFERLLKTADVMVVNFPLKVRTRLRMRYEDVAPINPRLIYGSMTGYGESGPDAEQPGFDSTAFFARSGLLDALTHEGGPPAFSLPAQGDQMAGMNLFAAIAMALLHRERTGEGSEVSTSLHAGGLWSNAILAQGALLGAYVAPRPPRTKPRSALANQYRTADGRWIQLTIVREDKLWPELCKAMERTDLLEDPALPDHRQPPRARVRAGGDPRSRVRQPSLAGMAQAAAPSRDHLRPARRAQRRAARSSGGGQRRGGRQQPVRHAAHALRADQAVLRPRAGDARPRARPRRAHRRGAVRAGLQSGRDRHAAHGRRAGLTTSPRGFRGFGGLRGY
jgi:crotonobetainyl-CoA:carnitine CoA-transferase CaiB-like acyl-CoA transferase